MHYLAKILVKEQNIKKIEKKQLINTAGDCLAQYEGSEFDYRCDDAGRWTEYYPKSILYASDDISKFLRELNQIIFARNQEIKNCLETIKQKNSNGLETLAEKFLNEEEVWMDGSYELQILSKILSNNFTIDNPFFNVDTFNAALTNETIENVKNNSKDYALVFLDCHF